MSLPLLIGSLYIYIHFNCNTRVVPSGCMRLVSDIAPSNNEMDMDDKVSNTVRRTLILRTPKKIQRTRQSANRSNDRAVGKFSSTHGGSQGDVSTRDGRSDGAGSSSGEGCALVRGAASPSVSARNRSVSNYQMDQ